MTRGSGAATVDADDQPWLTGTVEDQFTPIYLSMAVAGKHHGPIPAALVDAMDLTTIAALMGIGEEAARQRRAHERWRAPGPEVPMVPKARPA